MDFNDINPIMIAVGNFGFPLVLATYLLIRFEKKIENLSNSIKDLKDVLPKKPQ